MTGLDHGLEGATLFSAEISHKACASLGRDACTEGSFVIAPSAHTPGCRSKVALETKYHTQATTSFIRRLHRIPSVQILSPQNAEVNTAAPSLANELVIVALDSEGCASRLQLLFFHSLVHTMVLVHLARVRCVLKTLVDMGG